MRISDWSSDVCSSDLLDRRAVRQFVSPLRMQRPCIRRPWRAHIAIDGVALDSGVFDGGHRGIKGKGRNAAIRPAFDSGRTEADHRDCIRSEEHTSELQSLMRISYAVFCLKKKKLKFYEESTSQCSTNASIAHLYPT